MIWVAILGLIVLFIYAVISFAFLQNQYRHRENDDANLYCDNLGQCMYSVLRYGLTDNLGLVSINIVWTIKWYYCLVDSHQWNWWYVCKWLVYSTSDIWSLILHYCYHYWSEHCLWYYSGYLLWTKRRKSNYNFMIALSLISYHRVILKLNRKVTVSFVICQAMILRDELLK